MRLPLTLDTLVEIFTWLKAKVSIVLRLAHSFCDVLGQHF